MYNFRLTFRIKLGQIMTYLNTKKAVRLTNSLSYFTDYQCFSQLILIFVEEKVILRGIVRPQILNTFVNVTFVFDLLKVLYHFLRGSRA